MWRACACSSRSTLNGRKGACLKVRCKITGGILFFIFSHIGSSLQWVDNVKQRIRGAKRYLKADYKLHVLEESPCADHCIRFALSSEDAQFQSACDHDHTMQCDRCLDCKKVADDLIAGLESKDISYR